MGREREREKERKKERKKGNIFCARGITDMREREGGERTKKSVRATVMNGERNKKERKIKRNKLMS